MSTIFFRDPLAFSLSVYLRLSRPLPPYTFSREVEDRGPTGMSQEAQVAAVKISEYRTVSGFLTNWYRPIRVAHMAILRALVRALACARVSFGRARKTHMHKVHVSRQSPSRLPLRGAWPSPDHNACSG